MASRWRKCVNGCPRIYKHRSLLCKPCRTRLPDDGIIDFVAVRRRYYGFRHRLTPTEQSVVDRLVDVEDIREFFNKAPLDCLASELELVMLELT